MLLRMHESAFEEWEGVPEEIRYDQNRFNDSLLRRARHDRPSSIPSNLAARAGTDNWLLNRLRPCSRFGPPGSPSPNPTLKVQPKTNPFTPVQNFLSYTKHTSFLILNHPSLDPPRV